MITQLQKGKNYFYQITLAMLVAMISIAGCTKKDETPKPTPVITDFKATSGWVGDVVTITGTNFGIDVASNIVKFGDKVATVSTATITEIKVTVPTGATTGKISVTVNGVTGTSTTDFTVNTETVYIAGRIVRNGKGIAGYWKNNTFVSLTDGTKNALANAIAVVGNDIYVAGTEGDPMASGQIAKYWKNGVATTLSVQNANVTGIAVIGTDVYVAGAEIGTTLKYVAKYWKNGVATILSSGVADEFTGNMVVSGNDVYVVSKTNVGARYWKNGVAVDVVVNVSGSLSYLISLAVVGNDVYVGGGYTSGGVGYTVAYWKNGVRTSLTSGLATSLAVANGVVHLVGNDRPQVTGSLLIAKYWRNDVGSTLGGSSLGDQTADAIMAIGSDVYITGTTVVTDAAGRSINVPRYWKNGVGINLGNGIDDAKVTGIVVVP